VYPDPRVANEKVQRLVSRRRLLRRLRFASLLVGGLTVVAAGTLGVYDGVGLVRRVWDAHHRRPLAALSRTAKRTATSTTTTSASGPPACTAGQAAAGQSHWQVTGGTLYEIVVLDATSASPCTLSGYAGLSPTAPGGATLSAPVHDDAGLGAQAGASTAPVVLGPGQPAWFEVSYPVTCTSVLASPRAPTGTPGQCERGGSLGVLLPQSTTPLDVAQPLGFTFAATGFDVGPFSSGAPPGSAPTGP
jgi:hypothetical protein